MLEEKPAFLIGGHTRPINGAQEVEAVLSNYRNAIKSIFDQTIAGMNKGLGPDELVELVELPEQFAELDYLKEYYGNIEWSVRSIFTGYLGLTAILPICFHCRPERRLCGSPDLQVELQIFLLRPDHNWMTTPNGQPSCATTCCPWDMNHLR
jgi:alkyl sulfatase BDS1-like metallo-beta-lactamase superfamily hydrolase